VFLQPKSSVNLN
jgi:serine/threonine-protein phosphatase 2A regulatory subunit B'